MDYTSKVTLKAIGEFIKSKIPDVSKYLLKTDAVPRALGFGYGTCSTAAATTAKIASISGTNTPKFVNQNGGIISIKFTNAVPAKSTLNVNNGGAKSIFYHGKSIVDGIISAGDTATFIMISTVYHVIAVENGHTVKADVPADAKFTDTVIDASLFADKAFYGDTTINVGRKADSGVGPYSTAEGLNTTANGECSHAEGKETTAIRPYAHAEGFQTVAGGDYSHTEGMYSTVPENASFAHAEGYKTTASGSAAHAEGYNTVASGPYSHASGYGTVAPNAYEYAIGRWNWTSDEHLFSLGDGAQNSRHNAFEITKTGGKLHDKDIATTDLIPKATIKSTSISGTTNAYGSLLWTSASAGKIPLFVDVESKLCVPFRSVNNYWIYMTYQTIADFGKPVANVAVSGTVYYVEI